MTTCSKKKEREYVVFNIDRGVTVAERIQLAGTSSARRKGLLGVDQVAPGGGLWIAPCEAIHTFGMRMPIDAIFLDSKFRIRKLRPHLMPFRIAVCFFADSVLELEAGTVARTTAAVGDQLQLEELELENSFWSMS